jgi:hypothetical protein
LTYFDLIKPKNKKIHGSEVNPAASPSGLWRHGRARTPSRAAHVNRAAAQNGLWRLPDCAKMTPDQ